MLAAWGEPRGCGKGHTGRKILGIVRLASRRQRPQTESTRILSDKSQFLPTTQSSPGFFWENSETAICTLALGQRSAPAGAGLFPSNPVNAANTILRASPPPHPLPPRAQAHAVSATRPTGGLASDRHSKTTQPVPRAGGRQLPGGRAPPARKRARTVDFLPATRS